MGRLGETHRSVGVSAFAKRHQFRRDLLVIVATSKSSLASPDANTPTRRHASPAVPIKDQPVQLTVVGLRRTRLY